MNADEAILGDWGTTRLRLWLVRDGAIAAQAHGPGVGALTVTPQAAFTETVGRLSAPRHAPALLAGMVGSRDGWIEAAYVDCPVELTALTARLARIEDHGRPVAIVPGLCCVNPLGGPDVMRGEETQALGALALAPDLARGRHVLCLPGTHTKWAVVEDGRVTTFLTAPVGEVYALLRAQSTLGKSAGMADASRAGFALGLERIAKIGAAPLPHLLFETRARQLLDGLSPADAMGFLSGLLIGADIASALAWADRASSFVLIGDPGLTGLYDQALGASAIATRTLDGDACVLAGLLSIFNASKDRA